MTLKYCFQAVPLLTTNQSLRTWTVYKRSAITKRMAVINETRFTGDNNIKHICAKLQGYHYSARNGCVGAARGHAKNTSKTRYLWLLCFELSNLSSWQQLRFMDGALLYIVLAATTPPQTQRCCLRSWSSCWSFSSELCWPSPSVRKFRKLFTVDLKFPFLRLVFLVL